MLFDELDKKIREAAEQHHPAYDEKAWQKMEKSLDKHLPREKDDRRRIVFLLLLFILIGGGSILMISKPWQKGPMSKGPRVQQNAKSAEINGKKPGDVALPRSLPDENTTPSSASGNTLQPTVDRDVTASSSGTPTKKHQSVVTRSDKLLAASSSQVPAGNSARENSKPKSTQPTDGGDLQKEVSAVAERVIESKDPTRQMDVEKKQENVPSLNTQESSQQVQVNKKQENTGVTNPPTQKIEDQAVAKTNKAANRKGNNTSNNGFSFLISAGPDVSKAGSSRTGKTELVYGFGLGFTRDKLTLRTGVYSARKIYWASPEDYKLSYNPTPPTKFLGADANCSVLEVPLKLSYNFGGTSRSNWFAGAGISSYFMKTEKYIYNYKGTAGQWTYTYETKNENKHYFSVLGLSGGYSYRLNKIFSITAEPYLEVPLKGVGTGKVHLNSGGVLFSLGVRPFHR